jgi:micrococcal nuclease
MKAAILILSLLWTCLALTAETLAGRVVGVSDGDTITVLTPTNQQIKVRLEGIDAPESRQPHGMVAKQVLSGLVFGKQVALEAKGRDRYQRTLAVVVVNRMNVNLEMVRLGYAWRYDQHSKDPDLCWRHRRKLKSRG